MELWQTDVTASLFLADGRECKIISGIDDHSRFCVIATVVLRATVRAVCLAFTAAMAEYGIPGKVLTDIQAVHRPVRQTPPGGGAVRADLPGERHHPAANQAAASGALDLQPYEASHDRQKRQFKLGAPWAETDESPDHGILFRLYSWAMLTRLSATGRDEVR